MDEYPAFSLDHNVPLLVVSGLSVNQPDHGSGLDFDPHLKEQAALIRSEVPPLESAQAAAVLRCIQDRDASGLPWNGRDGTRRYKFRVRTAGRTLLLPPRRARLPDGYETPRTPPVLHSPFSPLSPISPLYPDGLIDARWLRKHQELVPSVLLCCYVLTADATLSTLHDNQIKTDISSIRNALSQSGYKTRLAVLALSDPSSPAVDGLQERLDSIRKGSGLDSKALFPVPPHESREELERIVENALTTVYTQAAEYYRDLGRHARKKRGRGATPQPTVPPTTGTSQTLSLPGWNVRYDFKSAVFAEYRQEMDVALRSFEQAYENLLSAEVLDIIPSWSPRWNEARLLADIITVRSIRCLLWSGQYIAAVRRWQVHRDRISDFVDRRGRGTNNYGWEAWEARWAVVMANLIEKSEIPEFAPGSLTLFLQPEKAVMGERLQPWEMLHHTGYWYRMAARHLYARRSLAYAMPEDDRRPPGSSPASRVASRAFTYDTFLCPEPHDELPLDKVGVDHTKLILDCLMKARSEFKKRAQHRLAAELSLECAKELTAAKDWENVLTLLSPLWEDMSFRAEGWTDIAEDLSWTLRAAAVQTNQAELIVVIDWELLNKSFTKRPNWHYDMARSLESVTSESKAFVKTNDAVGAPLLQASFVFKSEEGKAGESAPAQVSITSNAHPGSAPIVPSTVRIAFSGSVKAVELSHKPAKDSPVTAQGSIVLQSMALRESRSRVDDSTEEETAEPENTLTLTGTADLTLFPEQTVVFEMAIPLREPGEAAASSLELLLQQETFELEHSMSLEATKATTFWLTSPSTKKRVARANPQSIQIQPRPPKMEIKVSNLMHEYYTNERIELRFEISNAEDADAIAKLDVVLFGEQPPAFELDIDGESQVTAAEAEEETKALAIPLHKIASGSSVNCVLRMNATDRSARHDLTLRAAYHLSTDLATPIAQTATFQLNIVNPFEANYDLLPRLHPEPWPSMFDPEGVHDPSEDESRSLPRGLAQAWFLVTRYACFASEDLRIVDLDVRVESTAGVRCSVAKRRAIHPEGLRMGPKTIEEAAFDIVARKHSLDDRAPAVLDVSFVIRWSRMGAAAPDVESEEADQGARQPPPVNTTILLVPAFTIFGIEPRVLASVSYPQPSPNKPGTTPSSIGLVMLTVTIENPSNHLLTFGLAMEPSDDFAFSGAKQATLHLPPVSRRSAVYRLVPLARGCWVRPLLTVRDKYFQKVLRVVPTEGLRVDKEGLLVWVPPEEEEGEEGDEGGQGHEKVRVDQGK